MSNFQEIATQFARLYYATFDENRAGLLPLYREDSKLTWESQPIQGAVAIVEKIVALPFEKVKHNVITLDAQPAGGMTILVNITGALVVDDSPNPLQFSQVFILGPHEGRYFVLNDIFRLNYG